MFPYQANCVFSYARILWIHKLPAHHLHRRNNRPKDKHPTRRNSFSLRDSRHACMRRGATAHNDVTIVALLCWKPSDALLSSFDPMLSSFTTRHSTKMRGCGHTQLQDDFGVARVEGTRRRVVLGKIGITNVADSPGSRPRLVALLVKSVKSGRVATSSRSEIGSRNTNDVDYTIVNMSILTMKLGA